ncbi:MAG: phycobilisome rod-core linker polypeptide [Cyanobacteria bacterium P01_F01_bin.42]
MVNTFVNPVLNPDVNLGMQAFDDEAVVRLYSTASVQDIEIVIQAVYRQVLGNAHVMESERLVVAESRLRNGESSVRDFVRDVAKSQLYRERFVECCSRSRTIELNFKHLLGRAPTGYDEVVAQGKIYEEKGFEGEIDSYLDSAEYQTIFGNDIVPYARGYKTLSGQSLTAFTHWFSLTRSAFSSDKEQTQNRARLNPILMRNMASAIKPLSRLLPTATSGIHSVRRALDSQNIAGNSTSDVFSPSSNNPYQQQFYRAYQPFKDAEPLQYWRGLSDDELEVLIRAVYRQVLGNAYVMESERLSVPESQLRSGAISVREFVRQVAKSDLYRSRFFEPCYWYRAVELNFKHLLGRAPDSFDEMRYHSQILTQGGYEAEIDSYLDGDEYQDQFGEWTVPYYRGYQTQPQQSMLGFTNMFQLLQSASSSDKDLATNQKPRLTRALVRGLPFGVDKQSDPEVLIREALRAGRSSLSSSQGAQPVKVDMELQRLVDDQTVEIERLKQQLTQLQRFASIGESITNSLQFNRFSRTETIDVPEDGTLQQLFEAQRQQIDMLQRQIRQSRALAALGEARLNRWRPRSFG